MITVMKISRNLKRTLWISVAGLTFASVLGGPMLRGSHNHTVSDLGRISQTMVVRANASSNTVKTPFKSINKLLRHNRIPKKKLDKLIKNDDDSKRHGSISGKVGDVNGYCKYLNLRTGKIAPLNRTSYDNRYKNKRKGTYELPVHAAGKGVKGLFYLGSKKNPQVPANNIAADDVMFSLLASKSAYLRTKKGHKMTLRRLFKKSPASSGSETFNSKARKRGHHSKKGNSKKGTKRTAKPKSVKVPKPIERKTGMSHHGRVPVNSSDRNHVPSSNGNSSSDDNMADGHNLPRTAEAVLTKPAMITSLVALSALLGGVLFINRKGERHEGK